MKIVLVNPIWILKYVVPLHLAELAGYIRAKGYTDVVIVDLNYEFTRDGNVHSMIERSIDRVASLMPDVLGITCNTIQVPFCAEFCRLYKQRYKTPIILGGVHVTFRPAEILSLSFADYAVRGEETFFEILEILNKNGSVEQVKGCSFYKGNEIIHNPDRPLIKDLSVLPFPAYDLLLPYAKHPKKIFIDDRLIYITASRGCGIGCIFCSNNSMWGQQKSR